VTREPTLQDVTNAVEGRAAVTPSLLWRELGGSGDFAPLWLLEHLRRLGYGPVPEGFWWRNDIPRVRAERLVAFMRSLDETYPDE
jgi:hypothetical protein